MKILSSGPSELPRKFYVCEISLKKLKQYAHLREGGSEGAHLGRMCSPLIHKQIPFHVLSAQKDLWRLRNRKQNSVESVGHFLFPAFPCTCPLPARWQLRDAKNIGMYTFPMGAFELYVWPFVLPPLTIKITQQLSVIFNNHQRPLYNMAGNTRLAELQSLPLVGKEEPWRICLHLCLSWGGCGFPFVLLVVLTALYSFVSGKRTSPIIFSAEGKTTKSSLKSLLLGILHKVIRRHHLLVTHDNDLAAVSQHGKFFQVSRKRKRIRNKCISYFLYDIYSIRLLLQKQGFISDINGGTPREDKVYQEANRSAHRTSNTVSSLTWMYYDIHKGHWHNQVNCGPLETCFSIKFYWHSAPPFIYRSNPC